MSKLVKNYNRILKTIESLNILVDSRKVGRRPKMTDFQVIALGLTAEYMSLDSENLLFQMIPEGSIENILERSQFNKRRRKLFGLTERIRSRLSRSFVEFEDYFVVDSMPLEICKMARSKRARICKEAFETAPEKGYCASQNCWFYGYKLHGICTMTGVFSAIDITKANVHDIAYLEDIKSQLSNAVLLGDKGYISNQQQLDLFQSANVRLKTPMRANQKNYKKQPFVFRKTRKRIETLFSQLCDQFMIRRNYAKSFDGFKTRILSKITALTSIQYINKYLFKRNINNIKIQIT
jgi:hypothetical protein